MRLLVVGNLDGRLATAARIAVDNGAPVRHADGVETAIAMLCCDSNADLLMADVAVDIHSLAAQLEDACIQAPVVACGASSDAPTAVAAIHAGAKEYIPLPEDPVVIAAILAAVADDGEGPLRRRRGGLCRGRDRDHVHARDPDLRRGLVIAPAAVRRDVFARIAAAFGP